MKKIFNNLKISDTIQIFELPPSNISELSQINFSELPSSNIHISPINKQNTLDKQDNLDKQDTLHKQNTLDKQENTCVICYQDKLIINLLCNHNICLSCISNIKKPICAICRTNLDYLPKKILKIIKKNNNSKKNKFNFNISMNHNDILEDFIATYNNEIDDDIYDNIDNNPLI